MLSQPLSGLKTDAPRPIGLIQRRLDAAVSFLGLADGKQHEEQIVEHGLAFLRAQRAGHGPALLQRPDEGEGRGARNKSILTASALCP